MPIRVASAVAALLCLATLFGPTAGSACVIVDRYLVFPDTPVGIASEWLTFVISTADSGFPASISLPEHVGPFYFESPGSHRVNGEMEFRVRFAPLTQVFQQETWRPPCALRPLVMSGTGAPPIRTLDIVADATDFGMALVGERLWHCVHVTNTGSVDLSGTVSLTGPGFSLGVVNGAWEAPPGETVHIDVYFEPPAPGPYEAVLSFGIDVADPVTFHGVGAEDPGAQDIIGIYFEQTGLINVFHTTEPYEEVTAYLMIVNPSVSAGVGAWECCVGHVGGAVGLAWELPANAINIDTPPCFAVGIGGTIWPGDDFILLATLRFLQPSPRHRTRFFIHKATRPSIPGRPCYVSARDPGLIVPLGWSSGDEDLPVAEVNPGATAVLLQRFTAEREGAAVLLTWALDGTEELSGLHLWREPAGRERIRITVEPLPLPDASGFRDETPGGAAAVYWLQAMALDGDAPWLGQAAVGEAPPPLARDRMLSAAPNPFNPTVTLSFEMRAPGPVRLSVFDARGRRMIDLLHESVGAGPHSVEWNGRDAAGRELPSGYYLARLDTEGSVGSAKLVLAR